jgi:response regulator RpfG family c-di-GMP phosphodiesterase
MSNALNALVTIVGEAHCDGVIAAMRAEGWHVRIADGLEEAALLAGSGAYHLAVVACRDPGRLRVEPLRCLMSLQADMSVVVLVPAPSEMAQSPALAWMTADQVHELDAPTETLMGVLRNEVTDVCADETAYTIFCVDDDEEFLASLKAFLPSRLESAFPRFDLNFDFFANPAEAFVEASSLPPNQLAVIVADQIMPQMEGIELLKRVKGIRPDTNCVLLTGHAALDSAVLAINSRILDRYFFKPIEDQSDFVNSLAHLLRGHHLSLQAAEQRRRLMDQFELIRSLGVVDSETSALAAAAQFLSERLQGSRIGAALLAEDGYALQVNLGWGKTASPGTILPETSLLDEAIGSNRLMLVGHRNALPARTVLESDGSPQAILPLVWGGRPLGVIFIGARDGRRTFTRAERALMGFVRDVTSVAVGGWGDRRTLEEHYVGIMSTLMETIEAKDGYTRGHTERVTQLATDLARAVGVTEEALQDIRRAARVHDIGKIAIPDAIIQKPGRLDPDEYRLIQEHPARADRILRPLKYLNTSRMIVRGHHERYDGRGYPDGLTAEEIPLGARILATADAYDAMTSTRTYRGAMDPAEALAEIQANAGRQFDPALAARFLDMMRQDASVLPRPMETIEELQS